MNEPPARRNLTWTKEEDEALAAEFEQGLQIRAIALRHRRSLGAIRSRLLHLGHTAQSARPIMTSPPSELRSIAEIES